MAVRHHHHSALCQDLVAQLPDYIDGELEAALCAQIEAHLADCDDCRIMVDTTRKTVVLFRRYNRTELPPAVTERLWQTLEDNGCVKPES